MNLLFITQDFPPGIGGIQTYSAEHAMRLSALCDDFLLICPACPDKHVGDKHVGDNREFETDDSIYDFDIQRIPVRNSLLFASLFQMLPNILGARSFDATFHSQWQTVWPAVAAKKRGLIKKIYVAAHARELLYNPYRNIPVLGWVHRKVREYAFRHVDHFFPVSGYTAGLLKNQGVTPDRMTVVVNGTDPNLFKPFDTAELKRELHLNGSRILMTVTRLVKRKGIDTVLHALSTLIREFDDLSYVVVGTGPEETRLKRLARELGIESRVHFLGQIEHHDLPKYYNLADLFVLSSRTELPDVEGFGIVFLEANACEKPVIGTNSGGVPSAIEQGKTGLIVQENHPGELSDAIRSLLLDPDSASSMGKYGRQRVLKEANWETLSTRLFQLLKRNLNTGVNVMGRGKKRVLMIAPYFLPRRRVGSLRPFRFAAHLKESGWEPHIITLGSDGVFTDLEKRMMEGIDIHEINPGLDMTSGSGSQLTAEPEKQTPSSAEKGGAKRIAGMIDRHFPMDTWLILFFKELEKIKEITIRTNPDVIWSTGDPWSAHWLANRLSGDMKRPWVADFRDPWTLGGVELRSRSDFSNSMDRRYERLFIKNADFFTFTSWQTEELYGNFYPEILGRTATITNSYDTTLMKSPESVDSGNFADLPVFDPAYLNLVFFGKFRDLSPAEPVADVLKVIGSKDLDALKKIRVYSFGELNYTDSVLVRKRGVSENFITARPVPPEMGTALLERSDILLLSTDPRRKHIIPAKLWDYLAVNRPIVSLAPNPDIGEILNKTGAGLQFSQADNESVADFLIQAVEAKEKGDRSLGFPPSARENIQSFSAEETTRQLAVILDRFLDSHD